MQRLVEFEHLEYMADWMETEASTIGERAEGDATVIKRIQHAADTLMTAYRTARAEDADAETVDLTLETWEAVEEVMIWRRDVSEEIRRQGDETEEYERVREVCSFLAKNPPRLIGKTNVGFTIIAQKPASARHLTVCMGRSEAGFVIWTYNNSCGGFVQGDYFDSPYETVVAKYEAAMKRFDERSR